MYFATCNACYGYDEEEEEHGEDGESFGGASLVKAKLAMIAHSMATYKYTVVPGKYGELIQASYEIPAGSNISKEEYSDCEY